MMANAWDYAVRSSAVLLGIGVLVIAVAWGSQRKRRQ